MAASPLPDELPLEDEEPEPPEDEDALPLEDEDALPPDELELPEEDPLLDEPDDPPLPEFPWVHAVRLAMQITARTDRRPVEL